MRLLSEHESSILKGDLKNIKLPDTATLYLSDGVPHLFRRIDIDTTNLHNEEWLYIPSDVLNSIRQKLIVSSNNNIDKFFLAEPVQGDGFVVYPILIDKQINIVIVDKSVKKLLLKTSLIDRIVETLQHSNCQDTAGSDNLDRFMHVLLESKNSAHDFIRRIFSLIAEDIPDSCAGYYYNENGILKLRMTVGDLKRFDLLPSMVSAQVKEKWYTAIERNNSIVPAETLPEDITLLPHAPFYQFVHNGLKDHFTDNLVCIVFQGDLSAHKIKFIQSICSQLSKLKFSQFEVGSHIKKFYQSNMHFPKHEYDGDLLFRELNNLIDKQIIVSGVSVVNSDHIVKNFNKYTGCTSRHQSNDHKITTYIKEYLHKNGPVDIICDVQDTHDEKERIEYFAKHDTKSVFIYRPVNYNIHNFTYIVSSPFKQNYLSLYHQFLKDAIDAYAACLRVKELVTQNSLTQKIEQQIQSREQLIEKLISGYFHQLFSKLTVVMAEIEKLENSIEIQSDNDGKVDFSESTAKIKTTTDEISNKIKDLQTVLSNPSGYDEKNLSCRYFMQILPLYVDGYLKNLADSNAVKIDFEVTEDLQHDFNVSGSEIVDVILPLLISIFDKCTVDGRIKMFACNDFKREGFTLIFKHSMVDEYNLEKLLERLSLDSNPAEDSSFLLTAERKPTNWIHLNIYRESSLFIEEQLSESNLFEVS